MTDYGQLCSETLTRVPLEIKRFYGSPEFDGNGTMVMPEVDRQAKWPENHKFTGEPSAEIDDNWLNLIDDRYFSISEEEAIEAWGDRRHEYVDEDHGGYTAGLDVFHTLHCLVRQIFDLCIHILPQPPTPPPKSNEKS